MKLLSDEQKHQKRLSYEIAYVVYWLSLFGILRFAAKYIPANNRFFALFNNTKLQLVFAFLTTYFLYNTKKENIAAASEYCGEVILPSISASFCLYVIISKYLLTNSQVSPKLPFILFMPCLLVFNYMNSNSYNSSSINYDSKKNLIMDNDPAMIVLYDLFKSAIEIFFIISMIYLMNRTEYNFQNILKYSGIALAIKTVIDLSNASEYTKVVSKSSKLAIAISEDGNPLSPHQVVKSAVFSITKSPKIINKLSNGIKKAL